MLHTYCSLQEPFSLKLEISISHSMGEKFLYLKLKSLEWNQNI